MRFFPKDWSWQEKLMLVLGVVIVIGFVAFLFIGCSSSAHCSLEVI